MGTLLTFTTASRRRRPTAVATPPGGDTCAIVIFPGVRIERHELDLSHRIREVTGFERFDGLDGTPRPRKTS